MSIRKPKNLEPKAADLIRDLYKNYKYYKRRFGTKDPVFYMVASKIIEEIGELANTIQNTCQKISMLLNSMQLET